MEFKCASIQDSAIDGYGFSKVVYFQGCKFNCPNCHNKELQDFNRGGIATTQYVIEQFNSHKSFYDSIVFLGGEPLEQEDAVLEICSELDTIKWLYTGYEYEEISLQIIQSCDIIVTGRYREDLKTGSFPASSNQKIIFRGDVVEDPINFRSWLRQAI